jgi:hypothetical protein
MHRSFLFLLFITASMLPAATSAQTAGGAARNLPADAVVAEQKAFDALRAGNRAEGIALLARAVELGSRSARVYREYASLQPARAEATMARATELVPGDITVRLDYVSVLLASRKSAKALEVLTPMTQVPPDLAFRRAHLRASAFLQADRLTEAKEEAARMAQRAMRAEDEVFAVRFVRAVDDYAALRATGVMPTLPAVARGATPTLRTGEWQLTGSLVEIDGRITNMVCGSGLPVLEIASGTVVVRLLIDDRKAILIQGGGRTLDLKCGRQNAPVSIGYVPEADTARRTVGKVRSLSPLQR